MLLFAFFTLYMYVFFIFGLVFVLGVWGLAPKAPPRCARHARVTWEPATPAARLGLRPQTDEEQREKNERKILSSITFLSLLFFLLVLFSSRLFASLGHKHRAESKKTKMDRKRRRDRDLSRFERVWSIPGLSLLLGLFLPGQDVFGFALISATCKRVAVDWAKSCLLTGRVEQRLEELLGGLTSDSGRRCSDARAFRLALCACLQEMNAFLSGSFLLEAISGDRWDPRLNGGIRYRPKDRPFWRDLDVFVCLDSQREQVPALRQVIETHLCATVAQFAYPVFKIPTCPDISHLTSFLVHEGYSFHIQVIFLARVSSDLTSMFDLRFLRNVFTGRALEVQDQWTIYTRTSPIVRPVLSVSRLHYPRRLEKYRRRGYHFANLVEHEHTVRLCSNCSAELELSPSPLAHIECPAPAQTLLTFTTLTTGEQLLGSYFRKTSPAFAANVKRFANAVARNNGYRSKQAICEAFEDAAPQFKDFIDIHTTAAELDMTYPAGLDCLLRQVPQYSTA